MLAVANDAVPPTAVQLYVDGKLWTAIAGENGSYTYTLDLTPGIHRVTVRGRDTQGFHLSTTAITRVEEQPAGVEKGGVGEEHQE